MPTFLSDPPQTLLLAIGAVVVVSCAVWFGRRDKKSLAVFLGAVAVAALVLLLDVLFDSPREESVRRVQAMAAAADGRDTEAFVAHLADSFEFQDAQSRRTVTREQIRKAGFWNLLRDHNAHVAVWDFSREDVTVIDDNTVEIGFLAKGEAQGRQLPMYFRAKFTRQPDGQMRLTGLASFDPMKRQNERKSVPFFP